MEKKTTSKKIIKDDKKEEEKKTLDTVEFKGEYIKAIGRRKTAVAQVRMFKKGKGAVIVNQQKTSQYFPSKYYSIISQFLKTINSARDYDFSVLVKGGGKSAQAEAVRHGMARVMLLADSDLRNVLRTNGYLTRDPRKKERKKPGLLGARKRPQWSKR